MNETTNTEKVFTTMYDSMSDFSLDKNSMTPEEAKMFFAMASDSAMYKCEENKNGTGINIFKKVGHDDFELQYVYGVENLDKPLVMFVTYSKLEKEDIEAYLSEYVDMSPELLESNLYQKYIGVAFKNRFGHFPRPC